MKNFSDPPFATGVTTIAVAVLVVVARSYGLWSWEQLSYDLWRRLRPKQQHARHKDSAIGMNASGSERVHGTVQGVLGTIGGTPLVRVVSLSVATGCEVSVLKQGKGTPPATTRIATVICIFLM